MLSKTLQQSPGSSFIRKSAKAFSQSASRSSTIKINENWYIQPKAACACGGSCPRCKNTYPVQAKLTIGQPGDRYEREADSVADRVMRMPEAEIRRKPT